MSGVTKTGVEPPVKQRVLLIGGGGCLGPYLQQELLSRGYEVLATSRNPSNIIKGVTHVPLDFNDDDTLKSEYWTKLLKDQKVDIVVNNAAVTSSKNPADFERVNVSVPTAMFAAAKDHVKQVIQVSSLAVEGEGKAVDNSRYPRTKLAAERQLERALKDSKTDYTIVRPACIISPKKDGGMPVLEMATASPTFVVTVGRKKINPITAKDTASIIGACIGNKQATGQILVAAGPRTTWVQVLQKVREMHGMGKGIHIRVPDGLALGAADHIERYPEGRVRRFADFMTGGKVDTDRVSPEVLQVSMLWELPLEESRRMLTEAVTGVKPEPVWKQFDRTMPPPEPTADDLEREALSFTEGGRDTWDMWARARPPAPKPGSGEGKAPKPDDGGQKR